MWNENLFHAPERYKVTIFVMPIVYPTVTVYIHIFLITINTNFWIELSIYYKVYILIV